VKKSLIHKIQGFDLWVEDYYCLVLNLYWRKRKVFLRVNSQVEISLILVMWKELADWNKTIRCYLAPSVTINLTCVKITISTSCKVIWIYAYACTICNNSWHLALLNFKARKTHSLRTRKDVVLVKFELLSGICLKGLKTWRNPSVCSHDTGTSRTQSWIIIA
jgi:hypothetical protein